MKKRKKVLVCGSTVQDMFLKSTSFEQIIDKKHEYLCFPAGKKEHISELHTSCGGGGANAALSFTRLQNHTFLCSAFSTDETGKLLKREIINHKVDIKYSEQYHAKSSFSVIIPASGNQSVFAYTGINNLLTLHKLTPKIISSMDLWYIAPLHGTAIPKLTTLLHSKFSKKPFIFLNPGISQINDQKKNLYTILPFVDAFQCNYNEATLIEQHLKNRKRGNQASMSPRDEGLDLFFSELISKGISIILVTHGKQGVYIAHQKKRYKFTFPVVKAKNTVGAGDAFSSTFISFFLDTNNLFESLCFAATQSLAVVESSDTQTGLLSSTSLAKKLSKIKKKCAIIEV